jgi:CBS domain-containing protein
MLKAKEIMSTNVVTVQESAWIAEAIALMNEHNVHALIVEPKDEDDAYGIISEADIAYKVIAFGKDPKALLVRDVMTKPCVVVNPDLGVEHVARLFANHHLRRAPVIQKKLLGIVSVTDIIRQAMWWQG